MHKDNFDSDLRSTLLPLLLNPASYNSKEASTIQAATRPQHTNPPKKHQEFPRRFTLRQFSAAATEFGEDRYGYVVSLSWRDLIGYFQDAALQRLYSQATFVLTQDRISTASIALLEGVRVPRCSRPNLQNLLLREVEHGSDRIVMVGNSPTRATELILRYDLTDLWHRPRSPGSHADRDVILDYIEFVEGMSPFRFCFLCLGSAYDELIAYCLKARGLAKGLAICVGSESE
jgi:hypothetical protein